MSELQLILVEPQPSYIESSGRWRWPLPQRARFPGCCTEVVTASREWWEYAPSEAKPHPMAEGVRLRDDVWYWAVPSELSAQYSRERKLVEAARWVMYATICGISKSGESATAAEGDEAIESLKAALEPYRGMYE